MKQVYIVRHAKTEDFSNNKNDLSRALVTRGFKDIQLISDFIKGHWILPEKIIYSNALRTTQTAQEIAQKLSIVPEHLKKAERLYMGSIEDVEEVIMELTDDTNVVMIVAHNPMVEEVAYLMHYFEGMPTAGILFLQCDIDQWRDFDFSRVMGHQRLTPKDLEKN